MYLSINILAWNEERNIEKTLKSLLMQDIFEKNYTKKWNIEIIIIANGCTDKTSSIAKNILMEHAESAEENKFYFKIIEIQEAGKSNAWNVCVHEHVNQKSQYLIFMDADIEFTSKSIIKQTVDEMEADKKAAAAVDTPLRKYSAKTNKLLYWISKKLSTVSTKGPPELCGQYYCIRHDIAQNIWIPNGLVGEDGYLRSMILTNLFRSDIDYSKIIRIPNAHHHYEDDLSIAKMFRHRLRLTIGTALNCLLTWDGLLFFTDPKGLGAGILIKNRMNADPDWYKKLISNSVKNKGFWVLPRGMLFARFHKIKNELGFRKILLSHVAFLGFLADLPILIIANKKIKSLNAIGYW